MMERYPVDIMQRYMYRSLTLQPVDGEMSDTLIEAHQHHNKRTLIYFNKTVMILYIAISIINLSLIMLLTSISSDSARRERHRDQILTETGSRNDHYHIKMLTWQLTTCRKKGEGLYAVVMPITHHSLKLSPISCHSPIGCHYGIRRECTAISKFHEDRN
jgi:hypothetical protein